MTRAPMLSAISAVLSELESTSSTSASGTALRIAVITFAIAPSSFLEIMATVSSSRVSGALMGPASSCRAQRNGLPRSRRGVSAANDLHRAKAVEPVPQGLGPMGDGAHELCPLVPPRNVASAVLGRLVAEGPVRVVLAEMELLDAVA